MSKIIVRNYLEIKSITDLKESKIIEKECSVKLIFPVNFQINRFFYKNVGKRHHWVDRLIWSEKQWIDYVSSKKIRTYVLKYKNDLAGYFELILHENEIEIAYLGLLEEYQNKKLGSYLLSSAIKNSFIEKPNRVWVHTCSLDHKNALNNYLSRGMKIFKKETLKM
ncbi:GNAT family N-acetyltransferase [Candidatus Pelagibacter sp.]|nr:GNAT family N-acetyltransferase [Candidatus Pelagibacter sp.]